LDTGASISGFDEHLRDELGESTGSRFLHTPAGRKRTETFNWPDATLGGQALKTDRPVVCLELEDVRRATNEKILGIIGMDVLGACRLQIDFETGVIRFLETLPDDGKKLGSRIPIEFTDDGSPFIVGSIGAGTPEHFLIDTGAQGNSLGTDLFDELDKQNVLQLGRTSVSATIAGQSRSKRGRLKILSVGPFTHEWLRFSQVHVSSLGLRYFSRFSVTFDFPGRNMYLRKGPQYKKAEPRATSGLTLNWIDGQVTVESVNRDGPGEAAGLKPKDVLVRINNKNAAEFDHFALRQLLTSEGGQRVPMTIRRAGRELDVVVELSDD